MAARCALLLLCCMMLLQVVGESWGNALGLGWGHGAEPLSVYPHLCQEPGTC